MKTKESTVPEVEPENLQEVKDISEESKVQEDSGKVATDVKEPKALRQSNWSERVYFINSIECDFEGLEFKSEKKALEHIIKSGQVDMEYYIGYKTVSIKPIIKSTKIIINK